MAKQLFADAEKHLRLQGLHPVNPFEISPINNTKKWEDYMVDDIRELFTCKAIFLLKNWKNSKGARMEYAIAKEMGIKIMFEK